MSGFTLIELLVSIIIASIIVGTLLGFLVNILERDRTEQAKVESQEEIQAALNFIADDMTEAVYIYDADGLYRTDSLGDSVAGQLPHSQDNTSICNKNTKQCTPVLVFWKRFLYQRDVEVTNTNGSKIPVRCVEELIGTPTKDCIGGDKYTFSLVAYYLVKENSISDTWSNTSRIVRWEITDGIIWNCIDSSSANCPKKNKVNGVDYVVEPDLGFKRFALGGASTLTEGFTNWRKDTTINYKLSTTPLLTLVDFVDDTPFDATQDLLPPGNPPANARVFINITKNTAGSKTVNDNPLIPSKNRTCDEPDKGVGVGLLSSQLETTAQTVFSQRIPPDFGDVAVNPIKLSSFYACVNSNQVSARVFMRGNALARLKDNISSRPVSDAVFESFLPTANVRVFGRGVLILDK